MSVKVFDSVKAALEEAAELALHQKLDIAGRMAEVVNGMDGKTIRFSTSHQETTERPDDGRKYIKGADVSGQVQDA